jgi:hypothetical protein
MGSDTARQRADVALASICIVLLATLAIIITRAKRG